MATLNEKMTAIADAIRDKTGGTEPLTLDDMASGVNEVYEAGKKAEYSEFWEELTNNGAKQRYFYTFCEKVWNENNFKPTCNIIPTEADHMFYLHNYGNAPYDLALQLEKYGGKLDFSKCTNSGYAFDNAMLTRIPEIDNSKSTFTAMFRQAPGLTRLTTIDKVICSDEGDQNFTQTFNYCSALQNITFEGVIGRSISFSSSPLTVDSMKSIISCLKDYSTESPFNYTLTLKDSCKTALESDTETVEFNGATYTYFELITAKGWNLA
jgi:hypothetical protein